MLLVDTNIWLAAGDRRSQQHERCAEIIGDDDQQLSAPVPVIAETSWLILDRGGPGAQSEFVRLVTSGRLQTIDLIDEDWRRVGELIETYASLSLDVIDASIVAVAERLNLTSVATLNHRDFRVVRPAHCEAFTLLP